MKRWYPVILFLMVAVFCIAAGNKSKGKSISFHLEGEETSSAKFVMPVKLGSEGRQYFFSKSPVFTSSDIDWFYPFTSEDGQSFGAAFRLNDHAALELKDLGRTSPGKLLAISVASASLQAIIIDRPVNDGIIVLWSGLTQAHLELFQKDFPHVDDVTGAAPAGNGATGNGATVYDSGPEFEMPKKKNPFQFKKNGE